MFSSRYRLPTGNRLKIGRRALMVAALLVWLVNYLIVSAVPMPDERTEVSFTFFKRQAELGNVLEVTSRGEIIQGTLKQPTAYSGPSVVEFSTVRPEFAGNTLEDLLDRQGVIINARPVVEPRSWWMNLLLSFGPTLLFVAVFVFFASRMGGALRLGRSGAKRFDRNKIRQPVTFADVAGIEEAKAELTEIVDFLRDPDKYTRLGGSAPKGVLLVGAPGTGKTLLARAVAGEAGVPFFSMGASEFIEMIVGVGASRVRDLFKNARRSAPAIIFIDELDAIGRARGNGPFANGHSEQEQTLNQILTEMDGFSSREGVIVLAATNRPDVLDPALLRPGRFDRQVTVQAPDRIGREAILKVHTQQVPLAADVDLRALASATPGLVGADLRSLVNEATLFAARRTQDSVGRKDFGDALEKLLLGPARQLFMSHADRQRIAYHEGGHAIVGLVVPGADPVTRVTIMPRGRALGVTYQQPEDDRYTYEEPYVRARITGALGGRAAEELVYGVRTSGAANDMQVATDLARQMVTRWGMSKRFGAVALAPRDGGFLGNSDALHAAGKPFSEATAQLIDVEVQHILDECYAGALDLLDRHHDELDALAQALLERESLDEQEILAVTGMRRAERLDVAPTWLRATRNGQTTRLASA
jgi:cell division protease FtsH